MFGPVEVVVSGFLFNLVVDFSQSSGNCAGTTRCIYGFMDFNRDTLNKFMQLVLLVEVLFTFVLDWL